MHGSEGNVRPHLQRVINNNDNPFLQGCRALTSKNSLDRSMWLGVNVLKTSSLLEGPARSRSVHPGG